MRTLLIVFAILLLLLTLLGAFGGSIKYNEPFFNVIDNSNGNLMNKSMNKFIPKIVDTNSHFENGGMSVMSGMPEMPEMPNISVPQMPTQVSNFLDAMPPNNSMKLPLTAPSSSSSSQPIPSMSSASVTGSHFTDSVPQVMSKPALLEKATFTNSFNIEPFEADVHSSVPADY